MITRRPPPYSRFNGCSCHNHSGHEINGSSWNLVADSVGGELEFVAVEENAGAVVVEGAEAAGGGFECLDFAVEAFAHGIGDRLPEVTQQVRQVTLEHLGFGDDRWQWPSRTSR